MHVLRKLLLTANTLSQLPTSQPDYMSTQEEADAVMEYILVSSSQ